MSILADETPIPRRVVMSALENKTHEELLAIITSEALPMYEAAPTVVPQQYRQRDATEDLFPSPLLAVIDLHEEGHEGEINRLGDDINKMEDELLPQQELTDEELKKFFLRQHPDEPTDGIPLRLPIQDSFCDVNISKDQTPRYVKVSANVHVEQRKTFQEIFTEYRMNPRYAQKVKEELDKLLECNFIYPVQETEWASPILVVPKKDTGKIRVCVDFRSLNQRTIPDPFPIPFTDLLLDEVAGCEMYNFMDGFSGYNQIAIAPEDQLKTTFVTQWGTFAYRVMPFGLCNALATFHRYMINSFINLGDTMKLYLDDLCAHNSSEAYAVALRLILEACLKARISLNPSKCFFGVACGPLLGHLVSEAGTMVDPRKVEVIQGMLPPETVRELRRFLGYTGYYRRFIFRYAIITRPLTDLLQFSWRSQMEHYLTTGNVPRSLHPSKAKAFQLNALPFMMIDAQLFRMEADHILRRCVSHEEIPIVLKACHCDKAGGHFSSELTARKIYLAGYWWPSVHKDAENYCKRCDACQRQGRPKSRYTALLSPLFTRRPFQKWGIDYIGEIHPPTRHTGHRYIIVATDYVTKWVEARSFPRATGAATIKFLQENIISRFGVPLTIITDNGRHFLNEAMAEVTGAYGIQHRFSTPYHPQTNGQVKHTNGILTQILRKTVSLNLTNWDKKLIGALWAYRTTFKITTGQTPFQLVYGQEAIFPVEFIIPSLKVLTGYRPPGSAQSYEGEDIEERVHALHHLDEKRIEALYTQYTTQARRKKCYDAKRKVPDIRTGDLVLKWNDRINKFSSKFHKNRGMAP
ncbi:hypothetical protein R1sor_000279 [Riccia sorocarpa]|uniref:Integrase catalytic domain-containing protein n=1 Tax=Riccia sorocarpa TaxID=122646 RepID=A0ABD3GV16_9MARC